MFTEDVKAKYEEAFKNRGKKKEKGEKGEKGEKPEQQKVDKGASVVPIQQGTKVITPKKSLTFLYLVLFVGFLGFTLSPRDSRVTKNINDMNSYFS